MVICQKYVLIRSVEGHPNISKEVSQPLHNLWATCGRNTRTFICMKEDLQYNLTYVYLEGSLFESNGTDNHQVSVYKITV